MSAKKKIVTKNTAKVAAKTVVADSEATECVFSGCGRKVIAKGLCTGHYRQERRGKPLKTLRPLRGLQRLPMVLRVEAKTLELLKKRISDGKAQSMYDATRQALEAGIASWSGSR